MKLKGHRTLHTWLYAVFPFWYWAADEETRNESLRKLSTVLRLRAEREKQSELDGIPEGQEEFPRGFKSVG